MDGEQLSRIIERWVTTIGDTIPNNSISPNKYRKITQNCVLYRGISLSISEHKRLMRGKPIIHEYHSSWTADKSVAKKIVEKNGCRVYSIIFKYRPKFNEVFLNLPLTLRSGLIKKKLSSHAIDLIKYEFEIILIPGIKLYKKNIIEYGDY